MGWRNYSKLRRDGFAGGTVVHINAGIAGLVVAMILGKREIMRRVPLSQSHLYLLPLVQLFYGMAGLVLMPVVNLQLTVWQQVLL